MSLPQPNKAASVLAALIGVCAVIGKRLLARRAAPAILYGFTAFLILLALAYLACVFLIRDKRKNKAPVKSGLLQSYSHEHSGKPLHLAGIFVLITEEGEVADESGASEILLVEVIDDGRAVVDDGFGEAEGLLVLHTVYLHVVGLEDDDVRLCREVEEPLACHKVVAVATTDPRWNTPL